jgi:transposase
LTLRLRRARRDFYRCVAARIAQEYDLIGIEDISIADLAARADNPTPEAARWYRVVAAPGELLSAIRWAAKKRGATVAAVGGRTTWTCAECGHAHEPTDPSRLISQCPSCFAVWDQDANAAHNILAGALASAAAANKSTAALAEEMANEAMIVGESRWKRLKRLAAEKRALASAPVATEGST